MIVHDPYGKKHWQSLISSKIPINWKLREPKLLSIGRNSIQHLDMLAVVQDQLDHQGKVLEGIHQRNYHQTVAVETKSSVHTNLTRIQQEDQLVLVAMATQTVQEVPII